MSTEDQLETPAVEEPETPEPQEPVDGEPAPEPTDGEPTPTEEEEGETVVTIGDEEPPEPEEAPDWVRELRQSHRETKKENKALRRKLEALENPEPQAEAVGKKPTLEEFDYDSDKYEAELAAWFDRKRKADEAEELKKLEQEEAQEAWNRRLESYGEMKSELKVKDFDDAEAVVLDTMNETQQGIIVQYAENPAKMVYALGKNETRAKALADIKDPIRFAIAARELEKEIKMSNRRTPPPPEGRVDGTAPKSGTVDSTLDQLRAKAEKTGDYSEVIAYRRRKRAAS